MGMNKKMEGKFTANELIKYGRIKGLQRAKDVIQKEIERIESEIE